MSGTAGAGTDGVEEKLDTVIGNQTDGDQKTQIVNSSGDEIMQEKTAFNGRASWDTAGPTGHGTDTRHSTTTR